MIPLESILRIRLFALSVGLAILTIQCAAPPPGAEQPPSITVAAAANLDKAFGELAAHFEQTSGIDVVLSFGSTTELAQQIENGAPFDVFAAADVEHVDSLIQRGLVLAESKRIYARGRLVLWTPAGSAVRNLQDLTAPGIRFVAVAKPDFAPYGRAAVEALRAAGVWSVVEPKLVYTQNVLMARQLVDSGNADAGLTALSLVMDSPDRRVEIDSRMYNPIEQALGVIKTSLAPAASRRFADYVTSPEGQELLERLGYQSVGEQRSEGTE